MTYLVFPILVVMVATALSDRSLASWGISGEFDHLQPSSPWPQPDDVLIRYLHSSKMVGFYTDNLTICFTKDGKHLLKVWEALKNDIKASDVPSNTAPPKQAEREVPQDIALSACELWTEALVNVRYEKSKVHIQTNDGWQDHFAGLVPGKGWVHGIADSPLRELPPKWMEQVADALLDLGWQGDAPKCRKTLKELSRKLLAYEKNHP
jgi:hypothetical protein